ncbi:hypothetical protein Ppa06_63390 [Planomonospora parontospora subsp. parontospora]|uniref:Uncharacterized protein n=2 Tax=Planomonospora parontospora TaxID=58119 RepID=A0AA37BND6_9ACTN|nr:hypothetical protein GCM10010126_66240 [Planomonospora parontospora]GII12541.1 hypothetical protein Ppa06_63390 [Planomonospora parontospora subsp. parontospora]
MQLPQVRRRGHMHTPPHHRLNAPQADLQLVDGVHGLRPFGVSGDGRHGSDAIIDAGPEAISSATAETTVNHIISRRVVKKQQMRWTPRGAHLLLQIRTSVLNHDLETDFARWYPSSDQRLSLAA